MPYLLVRNPSSGAGADELPTRAGRELDDVQEVELDPNVDLGKEIAAALDERRTVLACGGDGTVNAVAQHLAGTEGIMAVLPAGTLNHFARDLGIEDADTAFAAIAHGRPADVDVGLAGKRVFVNTLGFGVYPELVRERETLEDSLGKWPALARSVGRIVTSFEPLEGRISADGRPRRLQASAVFVGNNRFSNAPGSIGRRDRLNEGVLDVRVVRTHLGITGRARPGRRAARSRPHRIVGTTATTLEIRLREPRLMAIDGEQEGDRRSVDVSSRRGALHVLVPPAP